MTRPLSGFRFAVRAAVATATLAVLAILFARDSQPREAAPPADVVTPLKTFRRRVHPGVLAGNNLLLITLDTVRRDHVGCYGDQVARTPTIDALSRRGVLFDHAVTGVPSTAPSHASMLTGLEVPNHGVRTNAKYTLAEDHTTLAEILSDRGYGTAAFVATAVLRSQYGLNQGFDNYDDRLDRKGRNAAEITDLATSWLTEHLAADPDRPFFMWLHYFDAHKPYGPPAEFAELYPDSPYDAEIAYVDEQIGRFFAALAERQLRDRTLIVLTSDHGEGLGEHLEEDHSRLVYDTVMRIPLVIAGPPPVNQPIRVDDVTVGTIDIMPTVLSLLGIESPENMDGLDLVTAPVSPDRAMYLETLAPLAYHGWSSLHALRRVNAKFILAPTCEYFDITGDPGELTNLLETDSRSAGDLPKLLARRMNAWDSVDDAFAAAAQLSPDVAEELAALGYISTLDGRAAPAVRLDPKDAYPIWRALRFGTVPELQSKSRELVLLPGADRGAYRRGMLLAQAAHDRSTDRSATALTLGIAIYRTGQFESALTALAGVPLHDRPAASSLMAMALHALGRADEARESLDYARELIANPEYADDTDAQQFLREAIELVE